MAAEFLNEAKKMLAMENGRASICTVQGLTLLFSVSAYSGMDRAGMVSDSSGAVVTLGSPTHTIDCWKSLLPQAILLKNVEFACSWSQSY